MWFALSSSLHHAPTICALTYNGMTHPKGHLGYMSKHDYTGEHQEFHCVNRCRVTRTQKRRKSRKKSNPLSSQWRIRNRLFSHVYGWVIACRTFKQKYSMATKVCRSSRSRVVLKKLIVVCKSWFIQRQTLFISHQWSQKQSCLQKTMKIKLKVIFCWKQTQRCPYRGGKNSVQSVTKGQMSIF